jgi:hypothetical protein
VTDSNTFQQKQYAFAAHIRDPDNRPAPGGIEDRRMALYRDLFFYNLRNLLGTMFPVLKKIHSDKDWSHFIREFMRNHEAKTPYFLQLPEEFLAFLSNEYETRATDFAFLDELAQYEYLELALNVSTESDDLPNIDRVADLLCGVPVKSKLAEIHAYRFPVHRISVDFLPEQATETPTYLAVYRRADDTVHFLELNAVTAALMQAIEDNSELRSGEQLLRDIAEKMRYADTDGFLRHGKAALDELRRLEILLGSHTTRAREVKQ